MVPMFLSSLSGPFFVPVLALWMTSFFSGNVAAEEPPRQPLQFSCENHSQPFSLEELRALALASSPLVAEIDREFAGDLAHAAETELVQNPELQVERTFTRMSVGGANDPQAQISIGQPLSLSHFGARERVAGLLRRAGEQRRDVALFSLMLRISLLFRNLEGYQRSLSLIQEARALARKQVLLIKDGTKKGLFSEGDEKLFEGEMYRLMAKEEGIKGQTARAESELARAAGIQCQLRIQPEASHAALPPLEELLARAASSSLSDRARVDLLRDISVEKVRLAELDKIPSVTPRLIYQHTNDGGDFVGLGLSVPLPLWNQNQGELLRAAAEAKAARLEASLLERGALAEQIRLARIAAVHADKEVAHFESLVIPAFLGAWRSEDKRYREGRGSLLQVWQTFRALSEVRAESIELSQSSAGMRAELAVLVGAEL